MSVSAGGPARRFAEACAAATLFLLAFTTAQAVEVRRITPPVPDDATMASMVVNRISGRPGLDVSGVEAAVRDAVLTLSGSAADIYTKREVERLAAAVRGLRAVENRIVVTRKDLPDSLLEQEASRAVDLIPRLRSFRLQVTVLDATVRLEGEVPLARDRVDAEEAAVRVAGIVGVDNRIRIEALPVDPDLIARRLTRLLTNKLVFGGVADLRVEVSEGGAVLMEGRVATLADRMRAERIAYGLQGVTTVDNRLRLETPPQP